MILVLGLLVVLGAGAAMLSGGPPIGLAIVAVVATMVVVNAPLPQDWLRRLRLAGLAAGVPMALLFALAMLAADLVLALATAPAAASLVAVGVRSHLQVDRGPDATDWQRPTET